MGNHSNKLERKFASLPPQNFPSTNQTQHSSFIRKLSRASKRKKHNVNIQNGSAGKSGGGGGGGATSPSKQQVPVKDSLFMPEYPMLPYVDNGRFKILEIIARGAFGNVVRVIEEEDQAVYAMKIMRKSKVLVDGAVQQCKDEATIQNAVGNHPFIVKPYYFFQNAESVYIVMEFIPRGELFAAWKHCECFSEKLVKIYIAELALVIDFLHRAGIIYRDLKMENILIDAQGHVQVIDFGLAKWLMLGQRTRTICGTLQYIAPEVLSMQPYNHAVDWWSLGILMYALLTGEYPVNGAKNHWEMAKKIQKNKYLLPSCYTSEARQLVSKLLKFDPEERIHDVTVLQKEPFFLDLKFETIVKREMNPDVYLAAQASFGFGHREASLSRTTSRGTSLDGDLESSRCSSSKPKSKYNWNESVASLNANLV